MMQKAVNTKFNLTFGKSAIVTGTSRGIGKEIAIQLLENNVNVFGISRTNPKNKIVHSKYKHLTFDLNNHVEIIYNIKKILKGTDIHILVNNAGISIENINEINKDVINFKKTLDINLISPFILMSLICEHQRKKKIKGKIINISSIGGILGFPNNPAYQASKSGLLGLTRAFARDYGKFEINCNAILPGYFKTEMNKKSYNNRKKRNERSNLSILNRWGELSELISVITFLCSMQSSYITGQEIIIDGGLASKGL